MSAAFALLFALAVVPAAQAQRAVSLEARSFGLDRTARACVGAWLPVWVDYHYRGPDMEGTVELAFEDAPLARWAVPVGLADGARARVLVYVHVALEGRGALKVRLADADGATVKGGERTLAVVASPARRRRVLAIGAFELALAVDEPRLERLLGRDGISVVVAGPDQPLPDRPEGYEPFSAIVLARYPLAVQPAAAQAALAAWVARGGQLLWSADAADPLATAGSVLDALLPVVRPHDFLLGTLDALDPLVRPGGTPPADEPPAAPFRVAAGELVEGAVSLAGHAGRTLVAARVHGLGNVVYAGVDLSRPPLATWPLRERLLLELWGAHAGVRGAEQLGDALVRFLRPRRPYALLTTVVATGVLHAFGLAFAIALLRRRVASCKDALWPVPAALAVGAIVAPAAIVGVLSLQSRWRSVAVSYQRAFDDRSHDRVYGLASTPTADAVPVAFPAPLLPTQVAFGRGAGGAIGSRVVEGERVVLEDASFLLGTGRPFTLALDRERTAIAGTASLVDRPGAAPAIGGWVRGIDLARRRCALLWGDRGGVLDAWVAHDGGWRHAPVALDRGQLEVVAALLEPWVGRPKESEALDANAALDRPGDAHERGCDLVWVEEGPPPLRPIAPWSAERHLELRVLRLPLTVGSGLRIETVVDHDREAHRWLAPGSGSGSGVGSSAESPAAPLSNLECRFRPALRAADLRRGTVELRITCVVTAPEDAWRRKAVVLEVARPGGGWLEGMPGEPLPHAVVQATADTGELDCRLRPADPAGWFAASRLELEVDVDFRPR